MKQVKNYNLKDGHYYEMGNFLNFLCISNLVINHADLEVSKYDEKKLLEGLFFSELTNPDIKDESDFINFFEDAFVDMNGDKIDGDSERLVVKYNSDDNSLTEPLSGLKARIIDVDDIVCPPTNVRLVDRELERSLNDTPVLAYINEDDDEDLFNMKNVVEVDEKYIKKSNNAKYKKLLEEYNIYAKDKYIEIAKKYSYLLKEIAYARNKYNNDTESLAFEYSKTR